MAFRTGRWVGALALGWALSCGGVAQAQNALRFSGPPAGTPEEQAERFAPLGQYLEKRLKTRAQWVPSRSEAAALTALVTRKVDMAWLDGGTYLQAESYAPGQILPFLQREEDQKVRAVFLVKASSPARRLADLKGRSVTFGPQGSLGGHVMPRAALQAARLDPARDLRATAHAASDEAVAAAVQSGQADAGAMAEPAWNDLVARGRVEAGALRVLGTSAAFQDRVLALRSDVPEGTRNAIAAAFLAMEAAPGGRDVLRQHATRRFVLVKPEGYEAERAAAVQAGVLK